MHKTPFLGLAMLATVGLQDSIIPKDSSAATIANSIQSECKSALCLRDPLNGRFEKGDIKDWQNVLKSKLRTILEEKIAIPEKIINEHFLSVLSYPQDESLIREIFERAIKYDVKLGHLVFGDRHAFHLAYLARSIELPLNFKFTVYTTSQPAKIYQTLTLQELIDYEKQNLVTNLSLKNQDHAEEAPHFFRDDEFLLLLLNTENAVNSNDVVGRNFKGEIITRGDVISSVEQELLSSMPPGDEFPLDTWRIVSEKNYSNSEIRPLRPGTLTCNGIHAADALLQSVDIPKEQRDKYINVAVERIKNQTDGLLAVSCFISRMFLSSLAHILEFYIHHSEKLSDEQKQVFKPFIELLPSVMLYVKAIPPEELEEVYWGLTHLYDFFKGFEK